MMTRWELADRDPTTVPTAKPATAPAAAAPQPGPP
jgi:hypothetical protein